MTTEDIWEYHKGKKVLEKSPESWKPYLVQLNSSGSSSGSFDESVTLSDGSHLRKAVGGNFP